MNENVVELIDYFEDYGRNGVCVAFSGGVDSSVILKAAVMAHSSVHAVTFHTQLHPLGEIKEAKRIAKEIGVPHKIIKVNEFENQNVRHNPPDRCYHCKYMLYDKMRNYARTNHLGLMVDGTNIDDLMEHRPGLRALNELKVQSPLADLCVDKDTVQEIAQEMGLSSAKCMNADCLATRIPYHTELDPELLKKIGRGEQYLIDMGFPKVRLCVHGDMARLEVPKKDFNKLISKTARIVKKLKTLGFAYVSLDMEGYRPNSMEAAKKDWPV